MGLTKPGLSKVSDELGIAALRVIEDFDDLAEHQSQKGEGYGGCEDRK